MSEVGASLFCFLGRLWGAGKPEPLEKPGGWLAPVPCGGGGGLCKTPALMHFLGGLLRTCSRCRGVDMEGRRGREAEVSGEKHEHSSGYEDTRAGVLGRAGLGPGAWGTQLSSAAPMAGSQEWEARAPGGH